MSLDPEIAKRLKRDTNGLFAAIAQERGSGDVLMVAWMDDEALARTLETREAPIIRDPAASTGSRERPPGTPNTCTRYGWTATATRCCWRSTRSAELPHR